MDPLEIISRLAVSLAIGMLVGLERGWRTRDEEDRTRSAGFRTFTLSGLLGGVTGLIARDAGGQIIGFVFLGFTLAFAAFHLLEAKTENNVSATSVVAGMLTFLLGALCIAGDLRIPIACAVAMTVLLALRDPLHSWVASLTWEEIRAVLILLSMSFLLLPFLPNRPVDPWSSINPYEIWLLAVLIAAISFGGYIAVRVFGDRLGVLLTAVAGGLASSTVTTLTFAKLGREHPESTRLLTAGILIAGLVMMIRVGVVAIALNPALLDRLILPLAAAAAVYAIGTGALLVSSTGHEKPELKIANPLALSAALKLAAFIAIVTLAAELLRRSFGSIGVFVVAGLSGIADVDAVTISMARLGGQGIEIATAFQAILLAVAVNTASKAIMAGSTGGPCIGLMVGVVSTVAITAGAIALALTLPN